MRQRRKMRIFAVNPARCGRHARRVSWPLRAAARRRAAPWAWWRPQAYLAIIKRPRRPRRKQALLAEIDPFIPGGDHEMTNCLPHDPVNSELGKGALRRVEMIEGTDQQPIQLTDQGAGLERHGRPPIAVGLLAHPTHSAIEA